MIITFKDAKQLLSRYAGKAGSCPTDTIVGLFVKTVIQELLNEGAGGHVRKWELYTQNGTITLPPDLQLPTHIRVDGACGFVGTVYDHFYEFYEASSLENSCPWEKGASLDPNIYFTHYDIPSPGFRILAIPRCQEDVGAFLDIQGYDSAGLEVWMPRKEGGKLKGEYLSINRDEPKFTKATFSRITGIEKSVTKDYVRLYWLNPETKQKGLLADLRPNETRPSFRRARILNVDYGCPTKVSVLGRVRVYDNYADSDILPITSLRALQLKAQQFQAEDNKDAQSAQFMASTVARTVDNENKYNRTPQASVNFEQETSPSKIENLI